MGDPKLATSKVAPTITAEDIAEAVVSKLENKPSLLEKKGDLSISNIKNILGIGNSAAYSATYYGEYKHNNRRLVRREEFEYRRSMGLDVCKK